LRVQNSNNGTSRLASPVENISKLNLEILKHRSPHTLVVTKRGTNYDIAIRVWKEAFQAVDDSVYWIRNDYLKGFMGEEKYKELFLLEKPGQEDLRSSVTLSWPGRDDMAPPSAKRTRLQ
jgi:hypothetical protein